MSVYTDTNLKLLTAKSFLYNLNPIPSKSNQIKTIEKTLIILANYHAVPLTNEKFILQYRHLLSLYNNLKGK